MFRLLKPRQTRLSSAVAWNGDGNHHHRIVDGKIAETWDSYDALGMLQQLGVIPPMGRKDFTWGEPSKVIGDQGNPEANKEIARRYLEELFSEAKLEVADEIIAVDYVRHDPANPVVPGVPGPEGLKQYVSAYHAAFPDIRNNIESIFAEGDKVTISLYSYWYTQGRL